VEFDHVKHHYFRYSSTLRKFAAHKDSWDIRLCRPNAPVSPSLDGPRSGGCAVLITRCAALLLRRSVRLRTAPATQPPHATGLRESSTPSGCC
jgi:hypothetical protein